MAHTKPTDVRNWLKALGGLCAGAQPVADAEAKITAYAPLLANEFGAECFTPTSLAAIARTCKFFPVYAELCEALSAWWKEHRPIDTPRIMGPHDAWEAKVAAEHAEAERDWSDPAVVRRAVRSLDGHPMRVNLGRMLASLVGRHAPANVCYLPPEFHDETAQRMAAE